jgi:hypothetical protein
MCDQTGARAPIVSSILRPSMRAADGERRPLRRARAREREERERRDPSSSSSSFRSAAAFKTHPVVGHDVVLVVEVSVKEVAVMLC